MLRFFITLTFSLSLYAQEIIWNSVEFPPSLITKGDLKDQGFSDKARLLIIKNTQEFKHLTKYTNSARAINNLKTKENYCFSGLNKNSQREKFVHFSNPFMSSLPNEIIIKKENLNKFKTFINKVGQINLEKLLEAKYLKLVYTKERSYSDFIDTIIRKNRNNKSLVYRPATDLTKGLLLMLKANRADYIIEYPVMVGFNSDNEFLSLPIENSAESFPVFIGCSKSKQGEKFIQKVNKVIDNNKTLFLSFYGDFLDVDTKKRYMNSVQKQ